MRMYRVAIVLAVVAMCGCTAQITQQAQSAAADETAKALYLLRPGIEFAEDILPAGTTEVDCTVTSGTRNAAQLALPISLSMVGTDGKTLFQQGVKLNEPVKLPLPADAGPFFHVTVRVGTEGSVAHMNQKTIFRGDLPAMLDETRSLMAKTSAGIEEAIKNASSDEARLILKRRQSLVAFAQRWFADEPEKPNSPQLIDLAYMNRMLAAEAAGEDYMLKGDRASHLALFKNGDSSMRYWAVLPADYTSRKDWPLVIFLHGGTSSNDMIEPYRSALPAYPGGVGMPCVCVVPKAERGRRGEGKGYGDWNTDTLNAWLDEVLKLYNVDAENVSVIGHSMGAGGTLAWVTSTPERFAAFGTMSNSRELLNTQYYAHIPAYLIHGADDGSPVVGTLNTAHWIRRFGGTPTLRIQPYGDHMSVFSEFADKALWQGLTSHKRKATRPLANVPKFGENGLSPLEICKEAAGTFVYSVPSTSFAKSISEGNGTSMEEYKYAYRKGLSVRGTTTVVRRPAADGQAAAEEALGVFVDESIDAAWKFKTREVPAGDVATCYYHGPLKGISAAFAGLRKQALAAGRKPLGEERCVVWTSIRGRGAPGGRRGVGNVFFELQMPLAPATD